MIHDLKPYPAMKDSGVPWLGQVPEHWGTKRLDKLFRLRKEEPRPDDQRVTGYLDGRVTLRSNVQGQKIKGVVKEAGWQRIHPGDFAISGMNAHLGGMGVSDSLGKCSPIYLVLEPKVDTYAQFVSLAVRHLALSGVLKSLVQTIRFNSADFKRDDLKKLDVWLPPAGEQAAIVRFLEHADRRIRKAIAAKQKLIKLLQEQKQVIIHQAVTRGLDPNVKLKPSGVEWLGDVPEGWEVIPLKWAFESMNYGISASSTDEGSIPLLTMGHLKDGSVRIPENGGVDEVDSKLLVKFGDLLFNRTNSLDLVGKVGMVGKIDFPVTFASYLVRLRVTNGNDPKYLNYLLNSSAFLRMVRREAIPSLHQANLNPTRYGRFLIPLPPLLQQGAIVENIRQLTNPLELALGRAHQEIALLRDYRTRLIADVVTGKLDVRDAAAQLPELTDEVLPAELDDAEDAEADELDTDGAED